MPVSACPPSASLSGEAGGDTRYIKVIIFFYEASSIQYQRHSGIDVRFENFVFLILPACPG
jgi:hypothetical protein